MFGTEPLVPALQAEYVYLSTTLGVALGYAVPALRAEESMGTENLGFLRHDDHCLSKTKSNTQHPRVCSPGCRQWFRMSSLSQPAFLIASARMGIRS
jgi:hypothetical protein